MSEYQIISKPAKHQDYDMLVILTLSCNVLVILTLIAVLFYTGTQS